MNHAILETNQHAWSKSSSLGSLSISFGMYSSREINVFHTAKAESQLTTLER